MTKLLSSVRYETSQLNLSLNHLYEDVIRSRTEIKNSYLTADASYRYNSHYQYFAKYAYDFEYALKKNMEVGFLYSKRCWDFGIRS